MQNQLALSGEKILEKVYPQLFHHIGMIRGEYLLRELNQNILLPSCQAFVKDYLDTICFFYSDEEVWYRFSELTNTEANCLEGTKEYFDENHLLFGYRGTRRLLVCLDEFQAEANVVTEVHQTNPNLSLIFPFVNDANQLKQAITLLRQYGFTGKVGTMIELPSAYFDLDRILETGISKIVVGMNDLTSFIQKMNQMGIECILHYSSILEIFDLEIDHPEHLKYIKEESKKLQRSTHDTARNVECIQGNQSFYRR